MLNDFDVSKLPQSSALAAAFMDAARGERSTADLCEAYRTGVMFTVDGQHHEMIEDGSTQMQEGQVLWYIVRQLRPPLVIEIGFGRGTSAAFLLSALSTWHGKLISIDPYYRSSVGTTGITFIQRLGLADNLKLLEISSEIALPLRLLSKPAQRIKFAYIDGSQHFDAKLLDFKYLDRMLEIGGVIVIDDAPAPAVRTFASFVANNLPYKLHYATRRLILCQKLAEDNREWSHFRPFTVSSKSDWTLHEDPPGVDVVPNATFGPG
jgi:predicted O-methyltransferase YrrM